MSEQSFSRSCYASDADLYKAKAEYFEQREAALIAQNNELRDLSHPFAQFSCSPVGTCICHNCKLRDALDRAPELSLSAHNKRIRDDAIDECVTEARKMINANVQRGTLPDHASLLENLAVQKAMNLIRALKENNNGL